MALTLPDLDDQSWQNLRDWLVQSIPKYNAQWTDFNLSDPGVTLLELLAWVAETLLYRLNQVPSQAYLNAARLLAGASEDRVTDLLNILNSTSPYNAENANAPTQAWLNGEQAYLDSDYQAFLEYLQLLENGMNQSDLQIKKEVMSFAQAPFLALSEADIALLAVQANRFLESPSAPQPAPGLTQGQAQVARAVVRTEDQLVRVFIVANLQPALTTPDQAKNWLDHHPNPGSHLLLLAGSTPYQPTEMYGQLVDTVTTYLEPRTSAGLWLEVSPAQFTPISLQLTLICAANLPSDPICTALGDLVQAFLNPVTGGPQGDGWPYDQAPTESQFYDLALTIPGVQSASVLLAFASTMMLGYFSRLTVDSQLAWSPPGLTTVIFRGLPQLYLLDISVTPETSGGSL